MALTGGTRRGEAKVALVVGATGLVGTELVRALISLSESDSESWKLVCGVARKAPEDDVVDNNVGGPCRRNDKYRFVECDLLDRVQTQERLGPLAEKVTHVFWVTWASQFALDTPECCDQNRAMLSNALDALLLQTPHALCHLSLQTGTKHYVSLKALASTSSAPLYDEESPRRGTTNNKEEEEEECKSHNFYYAVEDAVKERLADHNERVRCSNDITITWSVHRPGLLLGASRRSYFNVVGSLCVYGSICKYLGLPFLFCGSRRCWEEPYIDASDVRLVAHQHIWWAAEASHGRHQNGQAFNAVDGTPFTWKEIWPALAAKLGLRAAAEEKYDWVAVTSEELSYSRIMEDKGEVWDEMVKKEGLQPTRMEEMANWAFLDALFRFPGKLLASPAKARRLGFTSADAVLPDSFLYWVDRMRSQRLIPELTS